MIMVLCIFILVLGLFIKNSRLCEYFHNKKNFKWKSLFLVGKYGLTAQHTFFLLTIPDNNCTLELRYVTICYDVHAKLMNAVNSLPSFFCQVVAMATGAIFRIYLIHNIYAGGTLRPLFPIGVD